MGMDGRRSFRCWLRQGGCTTGSFDCARGGAAGQRRWNRPQEGVGEKWRGGGLLAVAPGGGVSVPSSAKRGLTEKGSCF